MTIPNYCMVCLARLDPDKVGTICDKPSCVKPKRAQNIALNSMYEKTAQSAKESVDAPFPDVLGAPEFTPRGRMIDVARRIPGVRRMPLGLSGMIPAEGQADISQVVQCLYRIQQIVAKPDIESGLYLMRLTVGQMLQTVYYDRKGIPLWFFAQLSEEKWKLLRQEAEWEARETGGDATEILERIMSLRNRAFDCTIAEPGYVINATIKNTNNYAIDLDLILYGESMQP